MEHPTLVALLTLGPICCPETSGITNLVCVTAQKGEDLIYIHRDRSLKSRMVHLACVMFGVHEHPLLLPCNV
jgi:hypothetical protein